MSRERHTQQASSSRPSRRTFVKGLAMGGVVAGLGAWHQPASAQGVARRETGTLSGTEFDLEFEETLVNFTGAPRFAHAVNRSIPAPILRWKEGDTVTPRRSVRVAGGRRRHGSELGQQGLGRRRPQLFLVQD